MTLRVSYLAVALVLLSAGSSKIRVNAADCTEDEQAYIDENYAAIEEGVAVTCGTDVCAFSCQDQLTSSAATLSDCTSSDGVNYYETLSTNYACDEPETTEEPTEEPEEDTCSEDDNTLTSESIANVELGDCEVNDPCETDCYAKLQTLVYELPDCTDSEGDNYYQYYLAFVDNCSSETTTEPTVTTEAPSTTTAPSTSSSTSAPSTTTSGTHTTTKPSSSTTESTTSSEASEEEETSKASASAAGSASTSKDNGATTVGGSTIGLLVVAGTLALLAAQN
jgi:hypothetical protein